MEDVTMYDGAVELLDRLEAVEAMAQHVVAIYAEALTLDELWEPMLALETALADLAETKGERDGP